MCIKHSQHQALAFDQTINIYQHNYQARITALGVLENALYVILHAHIWLIWRLKFNERVIQHQLWLNQNGEKWNIRTEKKISKIWVIWTYLERSTMEIFRNDLFQGHCNQARHIRALVIIRRARRWERSLGEIHHD